MKFGLRKISVYPGKRAKTILKIQSHHFLTLLLIIAYSFSLSGRVEAAPQVHIIINPAQAEIYAGSEPIILTADTTGFSLSYRWELRGEGSLQGSPQKPAISYIPPKTLTTSSEIVEILLTVTDRTGQQTIVSVSLTIYQTPQPVQPTPSPRPTGETPHRGMVGTQIVLGAGAIALLGGGIAALAVGGGSSSTGNNAEPNPEPQTCGGVEVGGYCWYLGAGSASCTDACASHGGYHEATRTFAGSDGTDENCWTVLRALGLDALLKNSYSEVSPYFAKSCGCYGAYDPRLDEYWFRRHLITTTAEARYYYSFYDIGGIFYEYFGQRACACNN